MDVKIDSHLHHKTILYIVIGIFLVVMMGIYMYMILNAKKPSIQANVPLTMQHPYTLTPQQVATKTAIINQMTNEHIVALTPSQVAAKEAMLNKLGTQ